MATFYCFDTKQWMTGLPPVELALEEPNGLLAQGGDLSVETLLDAYRHGVFPWYSDDQPPLWWSPNPRAMLRPSEIHISRSMRRFLRKLPWEISFDRDFRAVITACAAPRDGHPGTWITREMIDAYCALHVGGHAHSIECWNGNELVGGIYGVAIGQVFFAESMFSRATNASKVALVALCDYLTKWGYQLIDCQIPNPHLLSLGVKMLSRSDFSALLSSACDRLPTQDAWEHRGTL